jgi:hypothetical protein
MKGDSMIPSDVKASIRAVARELQRDNPRLTDPEAAWYAREITRLNMAGRNDESFALLEKAWAV